MIKWNRHSDLAILEYLNIDKKFWKIETPINDMKSAKGVHFSKGTFFSHLEKNYKKVFYEKATIIFFWIL